MKLQRQHFLLSYLKTLIVVVNVVFVFFCLFVFFFFVFFLFHFFLGGGGSGAKKAFLFSIFPGFLRCNTEVALRVLQG